jgi:hypothetical protein
MNDTPNNLTIRIDIQANQNVKGDGRGGPVSATVQNAKPVPSGKGNKA